MTNYPGSGQAGYGYGQPYGDPYGAPSRSSAFNVVGAAIAAVGAVAGVIALTAINWSKFDHTAFPDIHDALSGSSSVVTGLADAYFGWMAWVLLAVGAVLAIAANAPTPASAALRGLGLLVGLGGMVTTFFAIKIGSNDSLTSDLKQMRVGFYLTLAAFLLITIGAALGPRRT